MANACTIAINIAVPADMVKRAMEHVLGPYRLPRGLGADEVHAPGCFPVSLASDHVWWYCPPECPLRLELTMLAGGIEPEEAP